MGDLMTHQIGMSNDKGALSQFHLASRFFTASTSRSKPGAVLAATAKSSKALCE